jgi:PAS domain S-box-containing protein
VIATALVFGIARHGMQLGLEPSLVTALTGTLGGSTAFAFVLARRVDGLDATRQDRERSLRELAEELAVRRRAEGELRENEVRLLAAQELAQVGSWSWDRDSATVHWSKELSRILGREPKADGGPLDAFLEPVHPDDRQRVRRLLENAQRDGKRFRCEYRVEIGGRVCNLASRARPVFGPSGQVVRLEGVTQDVTEHREEEEVFRYRDVLESKFAAAVEGLWLAYQPIVEWSQKRVFAWEALMRSDEPVMRNPAVLLRAAEKLGKIQEIGEQVRSRAAAGLAPEPEKLFFVNLHVHDLLDDSLYRTDSPFTAVAKSVVLEITERGGLEEIKDVRPRIAMLRNLGFRLAIDDLGAGYSGLITFAQLEPDFVKLDMSLVRDVHRDLTKRRLVQGIAALCKRMGIRLIAEGIETIEERDTLVDLGCDLLQGYLFAMPGKPFPSVTW